MALRDSTGAVFYVFSDHLGSTPAITDSSGTVCRDVDYFPFGAEKITLNTCPLLSSKFATYERDPETGLDYAIFRYYNSRLGRFMSPDPLAGGVNDPQSLNRYAYVLNDPVNLVDPLGLHWECVSHTIDGQPAPGGCVWVSDDLVLTIPVLDMLREMTLEWGGRWPGRAPREPEPDVGGGDPPINHDALVILSQVGQTTPQAIHPCTIALFYGTSAALGAGGVALVNAPPVAIVIEAARDILQTPGVVEDFVSGLIPGSAAVPWSSAYAAGLATGLAWDHRSKIADAAGKVCK